MDRLAIVILTILAMTVLLILGGIFAEPIAAQARRRIPDFSYEGEGFLLWGLVLLAAFALGLVVMYLLLKP